MTKLGIFPRTLLLALLLFGLITVTTVLLSVFNLSENLTQEYRSKGTAIANGIAGSAADLLVTRDPATVQAEIDQYLEIPGVAYIFVRDGKQEIICHTFAPQVPPQVQQLPLVSEAAGTRVRIPGKGDCLDLASPILAGVGGTVHVGMDLGLIKARVRQAILWQISSMLLILMVSLVITYYSVRRITRPLTRLTGFARSLAGHDFASMFPQREQLLGITKYYRDEVGSLAEAFLFMEETLQEKVANLKATTAAKERIEGEMQVARSIQLSFVPRKFPAFLHLTQLDLFATLEPSREVGGDLYDFFPLDDHHIFVMIGDVSDKGVPAALFMAITKALTKATAMAGRPLAETMARLNDELCAENEAGMFVTIFAAVLDVRSGELEIANGGHNLPYILKQDGTIRQIARLKGMGLGVMPGIKFQTRMERLNRGELLVLYTDGVTEATSQQMELYGEERLTAALARNSWQTPYTIVERVVEEVHAFEGGQSQADDITMLVLSFHRGQPLLSLKLPNSLAELETITSSLETVAEEQNLGPRASHALNLAAEELFTNIVREAYPEGGEHSIELILNRSGDDVLLEMVDDGMAFNPFQDAPRPDLQQDLQDRPIGGLGLHLIQKLFHECVYHREGNKNRVVLRFSLPPPAEPASEPVPQPEKSQKVPKGLKTTVDAKRHLVLCGRLDSATTESLESTLLEWAEKESVIDCSQLGYTSSAGMRLLLRAAKIAERRGSKLVLKGLDPFVEGVLDMSGFLSFFVVET